MQTCKNTEFEWIGPPEHFERNIPLKEITPGGVGIVLKGRIGTQGARSFIAPNHVFMRNTRSPGFKIYEDYPSLKKERTLSKNLNLPVVSEVSYVNLQTPPPPLPPRNRMVSKSKPNIVRRCIFSPQVHRSQSSFPPVVAGAWRRTGEVCNQGSSWGNRVLRV